MAAFAVKSIQTGTVSWNPTSVTSGTASISSVTTTKAYIIYNGFVGVGSPTFTSQLFPAVALTNATTVTGSNGGTFSNVSSITVSFTVVEFW